VRLSRLIKDFEKFVEDALAQKFAKRKNFILKQTKTFDKAIQGALTRIYKINPDFFAVPPRINIGGDFFANLGRAPNDSEHDGYWGLWVKDLTINGISLNKANNKGELIFDAVWSGKKSSV